MDSILIYQAANDLVQNTGTRNIKRIARSCSLDILETPRFKDVLGFLSLHFDKPLVLINSHLDSQTKQMVCGYALGHYLEHQILMDLHTLNKSLAITDKEIRLYEPNAFASHLMLDSEEVYQMTKHKMDIRNNQDCCLNWMSLKIICIKESVSLEPPAMTSFLSVLTFLKASTRYRMPFSGTRRPRNNM